MHFFRKNLIKKSITALLIVGTLLPMGLAQIVLAAVVDVNTVDKTQYEYFEYKDNNGYYRVDKTVDLQFNKVQAQGVPVNKDTTNSTATNSVYKDAQGNTYNANINGTVTTEQSPTVNNGNPVAVGTAAQQQAAAAAAAAAAATSGTPGADKHLSNNACFDNILDGISGTIVNAFQMFPCTLVWAISSAILRIAAFIMYLCATTFNWVIDFTVVSMKENISKFAIGAAWKTFRDVANLFFIFILLYIAIGTILQLESVNTKKLLSSLIMVALLINFSLFFTEVIIDGTNIMAIAFLDKISVNGVTLSQAASSKDYINNGIANAFLYPLGLSNFFGVPSTNAPGQGNLPQFGSGDYIGVAIVYLTASIMLIIFGGLFLIAAILFITRFVVLVFVMMLSPLAFMGMILPKTKSMISDKWWSTLFNQALFAPIYLMMTWAVVNILHNIDFSTLFPNQTRASDGNTFFMLFAPGLGNGKSSTLFAIFNFFIIVVFMIATFIISKTMASTGGTAVSGAVNWGTSKVSGMYGRGMVRGTARLATGGKMSIGDIDEKFSKSAFGNTGIGRGLRSITTQAALGAKFGGKTSIGEVDKKTKEANEKYAKEREKRTEKEFEKNLHETRQASLRQGGALYNARAQAVARRAAAANGTDEEKKAANEHLQRVQDEITETRQAIDHREATTAYKMDANNQPVRDANGNRIVIREGITLASTEGEKRRHLRPMQEAVHAELEGDNTSFLSRTRRYFNYSTARHAAAQHMRERASGRRNSAEEFLNNWRAQNPAPGTTPPPVPPAAGGGGGQAHP